MMQIVGFGGMLFGGWYSVGMILGAGIGSPTGSAHDSYYITAAWMHGIPALVFLVGWLWVVSGFLAAPTQKGNSISRDVAQK